MTIKDIARLADVSVSTVSRSLNDSPLVADATKRRVKAIAERQGFEFNAGARGMITRRVGTIAVILPEDFDVFHVQLYHSSLHNNLRRALERAGLDLIVGFASNRNDRSDNVVRLVRRGKVDGFIVVDSGLDKESENFLKESGTPYVFTHYPPPTERPDVDWVYVDHEKGGQLVGQHFACRGHRRIVVLGSPEAALEFDQRFEGIKHGLALSDFDAEVAVLPGVPTMENGYNLVMENQDMVAQADALFGMNDLMAIGAMQACNAVGRRIPEDIAVIGYDDVPLAATMHPGLTTVRQPAESVAFMTCERLIEMIDDRVEGRRHTPRHISLQPQLEVRDSCRRCSNG